MVKHINTKFVSAEACVSICSLVYLWMKGFVRPGRLFYVYLTVQFLCLVTRCSVVLIPQVPSSQHSQCCVELAMSWSPSGDFVVCSGSMWLQPSSRYWQLSSWLGGSWASSGEWTWSSWQVSTRPAVLFLLSSRLHTMSNFVCPPVYKEEQHEVKTSWTPP